MTDAKPKSWHDLSDPVTIASVIVRDHLDTVIDRHGQKKDDAVSAAVFTLATALLEHLPGEAKQLRAEKESSSLLTEKAMRTKNDLARSVGPDVDRDFSIHAPTDEAAS